jgi:hypothetical protein
MRNILMTVMLLMVVALLFTTIVANPGGVREQINTQGDSAIDAIEALTTGG